MTAEIVEIGFNYFERPLVYVAGPYTSPDPLENSRRAIYVGDDLFEKYRAMPVIPHLSHWWEGEISHHYSHWLAYDLVLLAKCDALYRFSGYSTGADDEVAFAHENNIKVFYDHDEDAFANWIEAWDGISNDN